MRWRRSEPRSPNSGGGIDINLAFYLCCAAVALGAGLAVHFLRGPALRRPPWPLPLAHGALGAAGLAALILALRRGLPASPWGTAGFGPAANVLLALALALGLAIALVGWRRRPPGLLVAVHASIAVAGFVVLWTLVSLG